VEAMVKKLRPMTSREEENLRKEADMERLVTAIHEAGHAVVDFYFQIGNFYLIRLDSKEDFFRHQCAKCDLSEDEEFRPGSFETPEGKRLFVPGQVPVTKAGQLEILAYDMMESMAGPCAEAHFGDGRGALFPDSWFDDLCDDLNDEDQDCDQNDSCGIVSPNDYLQIKSRAEEAYSDIDDQDRFIEKVAQWTDELIRQPSIELAVLALADYMAKSEKVVFKAGLAKKIMREAFAGHHYAFEDPKWLERFPLLSSMISELGKVRNGSF
jgi:hypothetical protein